MEHTPRKKIGSGFGNNELQEMRREKSDCVDGSVVRDLLDERAGCERSGKFDAV